MPESKHIPLLRELARLTAEREGLPPSHQELAEVLNVSMQAVNARIGRLKAKGFIKQTKGIARSTQITEAGARELVSHLHEVELTVSVKV